MDNRGVTPVVGKGLEIAVVLVYVGLVAGVMYGNVVPTARDAGASAVADRTLVEAAGAIDDAIPQTGASVTVDHRVELPDRIDGQRYRIQWTGGALVLEHPDPAVRSRLPVALPDRVVAVRGSWNGSGTAVVRVRSTPAGVVVILEGADAE